MEFFKNRTVARFITIIVIILATLIGAGSSLRRLRKEAEDIFYLGEDRDGTGIQHDLEMIMSYSYNLTTVASRYMDAEHSLISAVRKNRDTLAQAETPGQKYEAAQNLLQAVTELYTYMGSLPLSESDQKFRNSLYADINSHNIIISRSTYNQHAREFNNTLKRFPANILGTLTFVRPLELYE